MQVTIPPELLAIANNIATQDNRITSHPVFAVQQIREYVGHPDYNSDRIVWTRDHYGEHIEIDSELRIKRLEELHKWGREVEGYTRHSMIRVWEFVTCCFTEAGAKEFIRINGHNLKEPRIYVYSGWRNEEWQMIRDWLLQLVGGRKVCSRCGYEKKVEGIFKCECDSGKDKA